MLLILFIPVALGMHNLYIWSHADVVANEPLLQHKSAYLNVPFFLVRAAIYFAIWMTLSYFLNKWSLEQDRTGDQALNLRLQLLSGPTLVVYAATVTLAAVDWVMSLDPHWFSTIFGMIFMGGQGISALCFAIAIALMLDARGPSAGGGDQAHVHSRSRQAAARVRDALGVLLFLAVPDYLGGQPARRDPVLCQAFAGRRGAAGLALVVLHFALPFLLLLSRDLKRDARKLVNVAALLVVMRLVDLYWIIAPTVHHDYFFIPWMYVLAPIGLGGIWFAAFIWQLKKRPLLPVGDAHIVEVLPDGRDSYPVGGEENPSVGHERTDANAIAISKFAHCAGVRNRPGNGHSVFRVRLFRRTRAEGEPQGGADGFGAAEPSPEPRLQPTRNWTSRPCGMRRRTF